MKEKENKKILHSFVNASRRGKQESAKQKNTKATDSVLRDTAAENHGVADVMPRPSPQYRESSGLKRAFWWLLFLLVLSFRVRFSCGNRGRSRVSCPGSNLPPPEGIWFVMHVCLPAFHLRC